MLGSVDTNEVFILPF